MTSNLTTLLRHSAALLWACLATTLKADAASDRILFDFQTATNHPARKIVNGDVVGGVSTSQSQVLTNGLYDLLFKNRSTFTEKTLAYGIQIP